MSKPPESIKIGKARGKSSRGKSPTFSHREKILECRQGITPVQGGDPASLLWRNGGGRPDRRFRRRCAFIFIGGYQPKKIQIDDQPRPCPRCGLPSARLKRQDYYLSLFFIPLIPIKRGESFLECSRCGGVFEENGQPYAEGSRRDPLSVCPRCGQPREAKHRFCPHCGQPFS